MRRQRRADESFLWKWMTRMLISAVVLILGGIMMLSPLPPDDDENLLPRPILVQHLDAIPPSTTSPNLRVTRTDTSANTKIPHRVSTSESVTNNNNPTISDVLQNLKKVGINLMAFDFDKTIIDIHTGGEWDGTVKELVPHVRPLMAQLIQAAVADDAMEVAIVTFSRQTTLIENVIGREIDDAQLARTKKIPVYGDDCCWNFQGSTDGKQAHIGTAIQDFGSIKILKSTTILIDDDRNNIKYAQLDGTRAVWYRPGGSEQLLQDLLLLPVSEANDELGD